MKILESGSICYLDTNSCSFEIDAFMKRDTTSLLRDTKRTGRMARKCCIFWRTKFCNLKPETNLALMLCLVFYLYICLGGALFLLLEGQAESSDDTKQQTKEIATKLGLSFNDNKMLKVIKYCDEVNLMERPNKVPQKENLWNFLEATDFAYQVITGQGTGQTTRILSTSGGKISYIVFIFLGIPLSVLTLRATGQRLNILIYTTITFVNMKVFNRQLTPNIHIKALIFNIVVFLLHLTTGTILYLLTQNWSFLDALMYTLSSVFTISNSREKLINKDILNTREDKLYRILFNFYSFVAYTMLSSLTWSAHHFTRHMRFKAQNQQMAKNGTQCPWVEVTRSHTASPSKSTRERETDRESVC